MTNWSEIRDLTTVKLAELSQQDWNALVVEVRRRANEDRAHVLRSVFAALRRWLRRHPAAARPAVCSYAPSHKHPLYFGGRL